MVRMWPEVRMSPPVFALSFADCENLLAELAVKGDVASIPVRSMIFFHLTGKIRQAEVYVDAWPMAKSVACVQQTREYAGLRSEIQPDFVSLYTDPISLSPRRPSDPSCNRLFPFLEGLCAQRDWHSTGVIFSTVSDKLRTQLCKLFDSDKMVTDVVGPFLMQVYKDPLVDQKISGFILPQLPNGHYLDKLKVTDVPVVLSCWPHKDVYPEANKLVSWLITNFPSVCIRDEYGRPISWILTQQTGGSFMRNTVSEWRNKGLGRFVSFQAMKLHKAQLPTPRWTEILTSNGAEVKVEQPLVENRVTERAVWIIVKPQE